MRRLADGEFSGVYHGEPGVFSWQLREEYRSLFAKFPDGSAIDVPVAPAPHQSWQWDGNQDLPTLTPSIRILSDRDGEPDKWHGHVTAGRMVSA
jgi:hypothetical protein